MVAREAVEWAYRLLLGREPEAGAPIDTLTSLPNVEALRSTFLESAEYRAQSPTMTPNVWVWTETPHFLLRVNLADKAVSWEVIRGSFEPAETKFVERNVRENHVVADIGANIGYFTMLCARLVGAGGRVFAFEPLPHLFESLERSIVTNAFDDRVKASNIALADRDGDAEILFASDTTNWGGACLTFDRLAPPGHEKRSVPVRRFDSLMTAESLDFIKIDVEGAEPLVMSASAETIERFRPLILSEIHGEQLRRVSSASAEDYVRLMTGWGYQCRILNADGDLGREVVASDFSRVLNVAFTPR